MFDNHLLLGEDQINYAYYKVKLTSHFLRNANDETTARSSLDKSRNNDRRGKSPTRNYRARPQSINLRTRFLRLQLYRRYCDSRRSSLQAIARVTNPQWVWVYDPWSRKIARKTARDLKKGIPSFACARECRCYRERSSIVRLQLCLLLKLKNRKRNLNIQVLKI